MPLARSRARAPHAGHGAEVAKSFESRKVSIYHGVRSVIHPSAPPPMVRRHERARARLGSNRHRAAAKAAAEAEAAELGALAIANGGDGDDVEHGKSTDDDFFNVVECAQMGQEDMGTKLWKHGKAWINEVRWVSEWREWW